mgnify:CR=1 FL=1
MNIFSKDYLKEHFWDFVVYHVPSCKWAHVVEEILTYGNKLRSTNYSELFFETL